MGRNHLAHSTGDAISAVLAAAGYNFRLPHQPAEAFVADNPDRLRSAAQTSNRLKIGKFADDDLLIPDECLG